jgi:hypothetical protein
VIGTNDNIYYGRIEQLDPGRPQLILEGFHDTDWPPTRERIPLKLATNPVLTAVPARFPPELAYPASFECGEPALVLRESSSSSRQARTAIGLRRLQLPGLIGSSLTLAAELDVTFPHNLNGL